MKVWVGYDVSFNGGMDSHHRLTKIFDCEVKAFLWAEEKQANKYQWREFEERDVE